MRYNCFRMNRSGRKMKNPQQSAIAVGTQSTQVLAHNESRRFLQLINDSDAVIYISIDGSEAELNTGLRLNANGGSALYDTIVPACKVNAISSGANKNLLVIESNNE